jgi:hypothetical protein
MSDCKGNAAALCITYRFFDGGVIIKTVAYPAVSC